MGQNPVPRTRRAPPTLAIPKMAASISAPPAQPAVSPGKARPVTTFITASKNPPTKRRTPLVLTNLAPVIASISS